MVTNKISIIMPAFNSEKYIKKSITSLLFQTYKDIELIIINDGSTDNTENIILDFQKIDKRIKYFKTHNTGAANARNLGLSNATGQFISFVDSDDYIDSRMMEVLINKYNEFHSDIIGCGAERIYPDRAIPNKSSFEKGFYSKADLESKFYPNLFCTNELEDKIPKSMWSKLFRRDIIEENNIRFTPGLKFAEDLIFTETCFLYANSFYYLPEEKFYKYVYNENSITHSYVKDLWINSKKGVLHRKKISDKFPNYELSSQLSYVLVRNAMTAIANLGYSENSSASQRINKIKEIITDVDLQNAVNQVDIKKINFVRKALASSIKNKNTYLIFVLLKGYSFFQNNNIFI